MNTFSGLVQIKGAWQFKKQGGVNPSLIVEEQDFSRKRKSEGFDVTKSSPEVKKATRLLCVLRGRV